MIVQIAMGIVLWMPWGLSASAILDGLEAPVNMQVCFYTALIGIGFFNFNF